MGWSCLWKTPYHQRIRERSASPRGMWSPHAGRDLGTLLREGVRGARESRQSGLFFPLPRHGPAKSNASTGNADRAAL